MKKNVAIKIILLINLFSAITFASDSEEVLTKDDCKERMEIFTVPAKDTFGLPKIKSGFSVREINFKKFLIVGDPNIEGMRIDFYSCFEEFHDSKNDEPVKDLEDKFYDSETNKERYSSKSEVATFFSNCFEQTSEEMNKYSNKITQLEMQRKKTVEMLRKEREDLEYRLDSLNRRESERVGAELLNLEKRLNNLRRGAPLGGEEEGVEGGCADTVLEREKTKKKVQPVGPVRMDRVFTETEEALRMLSLADDRGGASDSDVDDGTCQSEEAISACGDVRSFTDKEEKEYLKLESQFTILKELKGFCDENK